MSADAGPWGERVLAFLDDHADHVVSSLQTLVRVPSVSGSPQESEIQALLASWMDGVGLEVDRWQIPWAPPRSTPPSPAPRSTAARRGAWSGRCAGVAAVPR